MTDSADNLAELDRLYGARGVHGRIVETIGRRVISGGFAAGVMLPKEAELMVELGASRTSIREAVKVLAAKGLLETRQKRGTIVRPQSAWNLLDPDILAWVTDAGAALTLIPQLGELRRLIEPGAVRLAALRHDAAQLAGVQQALLAMRRAIGRPVDYYHADLAFHRALFAATGNPMIDQLGGIVGAILSVTFALHRRSLLPMEEGVVLHERVFDRVAARDADGAEAAMLAIIDGSQAELARRLDPTTRPAGR